MAVVAGALTACCCCFDLLPDAIISLVPFCHTTGLASADYPVTDLLQMLGRAARPGVDAVGRALLMCAAPRKEYYKKFLFEPLPVESHLNHYLHDHFVAEVRAEPLLPAAAAADISRIYGADIWIRFRGYMDMNIIYASRPGAS